MSLLTKPVAEMTPSEVLIAAKIGRLQFDPNENSAETLKEYDSLPSKEELLKKLESEQSQSL
jgi:hypothetical protein